MLETVAYISLVFSGVFIFFVVNGTLPNFIIEPYLKAQRAQSQQEIDQLNKKLVAFTSSPPSQKQQQESKDSSSSVAKNSQTLSAPEGHPEEHTKSADPTLPDPVDLPPSQLDDDESSPAITQLKSALEEANRLLEEERTISKKLFEKLEKAQQTASQATTLKKEKDKLQQEKTNLEIELRELKRKAEQPPAKVSKSSPLKDMFSFNKKDKAPKTTHEQTEKKPEPKEIQIPDISDEALESLSRTKSSARSSPTKLQDLFSRGEEDQSDSTETYTPTKKKPTRTPSLQGIFADLDINVPEEKKVVKAIPWWTPQGKVIQGYGVTEDINKKKKSARKKDSISSYLGGKTMEDTNIVVWPFDSSPKAGLFCVFDGHAGAGCSTAAKKVFPEEFQRLLHELKPDMSDLSEFFTIVYSNVDDKLKQYDTEGCTATTVYVWEHNNERYLQCANVGDSTAFLKMDNEVIQLSLDHKPTKDYEKERFAQSGIVLSKGATRIGGLAVSRALGDHYAKQENCGLISIPEVSKPIVLGKNQSILIIASDGLWDVMTGSGAFELIEGKSDPQVMADYLIKTALQNSKCLDNITVMVVLL